MYGLSFSFKASYAGQAQTTDLNECRPEKKDVKQFYGEKARENEFST
ncbi:MAG: hypothetical protein AAF551_10125 [Bacteroidota bacterium]